MSSSQQKLASVHKWNDELAQKVVEAFRDEPLLWDLRLKRSRWSRDQAWDRLAVRVGIVRADVERKVNSLLAQYRRERIRLYRVEHGGQADGKPWRGYPWFDFLAKMDAGRKLRDVGVRRQCGDKGSHKRKTTDEEGDEENENMLDFNFDHEDTQGDQASDEYDNEDEYDDYQLEAMRPEVIVEEMEADEGEEEEEEEEEDVKPKLKPPSKNHMSLVAIHTTTASTTSNPNITVQAFRRILPKPTNTPSTIFAPIRCPTVVSLRPATSSATRQQLPAKQSATSLTQIRFRPIQPKVTTTTSNSSTPTTYRLAPAHMVAASPKVVPPPPVITSTPRALAVSSTVSSSTRDAHDIFGEYIADKMRRLEARVGTQAQFEINRILYEAEMGTGAFARSS